MTARDIIVLALKVSGVLGVGQSASAEDATDALRLMNMMLAGWAQKRWLIPNLVDVTLPNTGAQSYSIGPGGDVNMARPTRVQAAFARQNFPDTVNAGGTVDYPLTVIGTREEYAEIALKSLSSIPSAVFLDTTSPLARLYIWPVPMASTWTVHLTLRASIVRFANLSDPVTLPEEYHEALLYCLAARLRPAYQLPPDPSLVALATTALNTVRNANAKMPPLQMPRELGGRGSHGFGPSTPASGTPFTLDEGLLG